MTYDDLVKIALKLPGTEETVGTSGSCAESRRTVDVLAEEVGAFGAKA